MAYGKNHRSRANSWFLHRITGTFLVFLLLTHFWIQHYDATTASVTHSVTMGSIAPGEDTVEQDLIDAGVLPTYPDKAIAAVEARRAADPEKWGQPGAAVTSYDVTMLRLADPVYAVLWKGFNILFLLFALHHGFYGLNNILTDYIRHPMMRVVASTLSWTVALVLLIVGLYSVITAGWGL